MPFPINPNDDNITNLSPTFRDYVLNKNLQQINPELLQSGFSFFGLGNPYTPPNNTNVVDVPSISSISTQFRDSNLDKNLILQNPDFDQLDGSEFFSNLSGYLTSRGQQYVIPSLLEQLQNPGDVFTNIFINRNISNLGQNTYGPSQINYYNSPNRPTEITGFKQYPSESGADIRSSIIGRQLGFSSISGLNFDSELNEVGKARRVFETTERVKLNFISDTVGSLNLNPFKLLTGGNIIEPNYNITVPASIIGKVAQFAANLTSFNTPTSIIPGSKTTTRIGSDDFQEDLLRYTGRGQKDSLFNNVYINKYTPSQITPPETEDKSKLLNSVSKLFTGPTPPQPKTYLSTPEEFESATQSIEERERGFLNRINSSVGNFVDNLVNKTNENPIELQPTLDLIPLDPRSAMGSDSSKSGLDDLGFDNTSESESFNIFGDFENPISGRKTEELNGEYGTGEADLAIIESLIDWRERPSFIEEEVQARRPGLFTTDSSDPIISQQTELTSPNPFKRGILKYTQDLINNAKNSQSGEKSAARYIGIFDSDRNLGDFKDYEGYPIKAHTKVSKGNLVKSGKLCTKKRFESGECNGTVQGEEFDSYYCRSWSTRNPYHKYIDLIRHSDLKRDEKVKNFSVLEETGLVKIAPYAKDFEEFKDKPGIQTEEVRRYMFSIENLAWKDSAEFFSLPKIEQGYFGGRIMWFPPYDISFTDNSSVDWETHTFIGRPEPIYTYNHSERKGTLSFTIIMDNPSIINSKKQFDTDEKFWRFFAGCKEADFEILKEVIDITEIQEELVSIPKEIPPPPTPKAAPEKFSFYFRNAKIDKKGNDDFRTGDGRRMEEEIKSNYENSGLNKGFSTKVDELFEFLNSEDGKKYTVKIESFASSAAPDLYNKVLTIDRSWWSYLYLSDLYKKKFPNGLDAFPDFDLGQFGYVCISSTEKGCFTSLSEATQNKPGYEDLKIEKKDTPPDSDIKNKVILISAGQDFAKGPKDEDFNSTNTNPNSQQSKSDRRVDISLVLNPNLVEESNDTNFEDREIPNVELDFTVERISKTVKIGEDVNELEIESPLDYIYDESKYFEKIKKDDPFIYEQIKEKIKHFHPAFHSMTPEGFNERLNFLLQCTKPGSSTILNTPSETQATIKNLSFGRPPICILRIGDFYHSKIVIDSVNFSFDPLQWDLNPEGAGVQPMLTKVDLNFSFIGGSSLGGPIKQLQNALSYNFFANTSIYKPYKEEKVKKTKDGSTSTFGRNRSEGGDFDPIEYEEITINSGAFISPEEYASYFKNTVDSTPPKTSTESVGESGSEDKVDNTGGESINENTVIENVVPPTPEVKQEVQNKNTAITTPPENKFLKNIKILPIDYPVCNNGNCLDKKGVLTFETTGSYKLTKINITGDGLSNANLVNSTDESGKDVLVVDIKNIKEYGFVCDKQYTFTISGKEDNKNVTATRTLDPKKYVKGCKTTTTKPPQIKLEDVLINKTLESLSANGTSNSSFKPTSPMVFEINSSPENTFEIKSITAYLGNAVTSNPPAKTFSISPKNVPGTKSTSAGREWDCNKQVRLIVKGVDGNGVESSVDKTFSLKGKLQNCSK